MFSKTEFKESILSSIQPPRGLTSPKKKKKFWLIGVRSTPSNNNSKKQKTFHHTHFMMDHRSQQEHLTMATLQLEQSKMLSVDTLPKLVITFQEDLDGIVMDYQFNMRSIKNWK